MLYISAIAPQWYNQSRVLFCVPKPATAIARRALHSSPQLWPEQPETIYSGCGAHLSSAHSLTN